MYFHKKNVPLCSESKGTASTRIYEIIDITINKKYPDSRRGIFLFECFSSFVYVVIPIENRFYEGKGRDKIDINQIYVLL